ncbi:MAG: hypothetical protein CMO74_13990 [Verrucomicrobiales bacterium]|nr:hypothetical protein [Verrucomicrobiales bacterium]|tara:strand:+ start:53674 stop:54063 length:390 start_codon:yes stop_codon:yes gene_type:complete
MSDLETLWDTHDFALSKVAMLEDEYHFLVGQVHDYFAQEAGESFEAPINKDDLLSQFNEVEQGLDNYYNKQLTTIMELEEFYEENAFSIPPEREVSAASFKELKLVTANLRDALKESSEEIKIILTSDN